MAVFSRSRRPDQSEGSHSRFSSLLSRPVAPDRAGADHTEAVRPDPAASGLKPSAMRGNEALYGYVVGLELVVVAILNLTVTHGKGAPAHPSTTMAVLGLVASVAFFGVVRLKNRMAAGFGAIVAAFFVTLPAVPTSLAFAHIFALVIPMAYGLIITQRQRKDTPKVARGAAASSGRGTAPAGGPAGRRTGKAGKAGKGGEPVSGPRANARYTPPKSKRQPSKKS